MQLYERITSEKGRISYRPYSEPVDDLEECTQIEITDSQALTLAGALGGTLLYLFERNMPAHKRSARKIKAVHTAILDLYTGTGHAFDVEVGDWLMECWDETIKRAMDVPNGN